MPPRIERPQIGSSQQTSQKNLIKRAVRLERSGYCILNADTDNKFFMLIGELYVQNFGDLSDQKGTLYVFLFLLLRKFLMVTQIRRQGTILFPIGNSGQNFLANKICFDFHVSFSKSMSH